ncbi:MAG: hypothetical protein OEY29_07980 [Gammaproteobacteria bacterium]|nr:hypothetical protein [Gammaproteobacteria bacterium]
MSAQIYDPNLSADDTFSAENYFIHIIKRAVKNAQNIHVNLPGQGHINILASAGEYFNYTDDIELFCKADISDFKVTVLNKNDSTAGDDIGRNIDELMWIAGFHASDGRLMEGCFRDDVVELMHWPNLTRLPSTPNTMRIASLLSHHPTSITLAQRFLKVDKTEAYQFYSAARCAGLARAVNRTPQEPSLKPHRNQALLSLLLNKISRI